MAIPSPFAQNLPSDLPPLQLDAFQRWGLITAHQDPFADYEIAAQNRRLDMASRELDLRQAGLGIDQSNAFANRMSSRASLMNAETSKMSVASQIAEAEEKLKLEKDKLAAYRDLTNEREKAGMDLAATLGPAFNQDFNDVISTFQADPALQNKDVVSALQGRSFKAFLDAVGSGAKPEVASDQVLSSLENFLAKKLTYRRQQAFLGTLAPDDLGTPLRSLSALPPPPSEEDLMRNILMSARFGP